MVNGRFFRFKYDHSRRSFDACGGSASIGLLEAGLVASCGAIGWRIGKNLPEVRDLIHDGAVMLRDVVGRRGQRDDSEQIAP